MRKLATLLPMLLLTSCYMYDSSISFKPIVDGVLVEEIVGKPERFQFWVGQAAVQRLGEPPYEGARLLAQAELQQRGLCPTGVKVAPSSFVNPGTNGLAFVAECL